MPADLKREVEEAAALLGTTFTSFATESLVERARQVKRNHEAIVLNDQDRDAFLELLSRPPDPTDALISLMTTRVTI
jgi:uncharacterized protein (DUF1778 family)